MLNVNHKLSGRVRVGHATLCFKTATVRDGGTASATSGPLGTKTRIHKDLLSARRSVESFTILQWQSIFSSLFNSAP